MLRQLLCFQFPGIGGRDAYKFLNVGHHRAVHFAVILIRQHAGEGDDLPILQIIPDVDHQCVNALGIVSAVDDEQGVAAHDIKPAGPGNVPDAIANVLLRNLPALFDQGVGYAQHHGCVVQLMVTQQGQEQLLAASAIENLTLQRVGTQVQAVEIRLF